MSNMQEYTNQIVVYANENGWYESESLQKMLQSGAVQSRSGRGECVGLKDKSRKEMYTVRITVMACSSERAMAFCYNTGINVGMIQGVKSLE